MITILQGVETTGGIIQPTSNLSWGSLGSSPYASWTNWLYWTDEVNNIVVQLDIDAGNDDLRTPLLTVDCQGLISVELKITAAFETDSDGQEVGLFAGEETTINLDQGDVDIYVRGRFYRWTVTIEPDSQEQIPLLFGINGTFGTDEFEEYFKDLDTSTLAGTIDARLVDSTVGVCSSIIATAHQEGVTYSSGLYQDRQYAIPDDFVFQENAIVVNVVSKAPPTIRCFDLNGESIDAVVDISLRGLTRISLTPTGVVEST